MSTVTEYQTFAEFDAYEDAIEHARVQMTLHRRERRKWAVGRMSLGPLQLQWGTSGGSMVSEGEIVPGGHALFIPLSRFTTNAVNGCRLSEGLIMVAESGAEFCISADNANHWCSLFIPSDSPSLDEDRGAQPCQPGEETEETLSGCRVVSLGRDRLRKLRRAVRQAIAGVCGDPVADPPAHDSTLTLQQFAQSAILQTPFAEHLSRGRPRMNRDAVVRLVQSDWEDESNQPSTPGGLAEVAGVSERTLLRIFREWFGISPRRYARLRKIHAVRDALLAADHHSTTVTSVLLRHDVQQFGRFAGVYRSLFGELPSQTLLRSKR